ncbi:MAG: dihydrolipoyl dehydrogenase [Spirochaeta sp. LUC14_002_19_P3]|nr:MAG: dihydrolipoyl dehydrogenase [Spirochaeta sp. LUC14_002_19_P3]
MAEILQCGTAVLGGGPGGYTAAFRAADLGQDVILIEERDCLGGVCLNVGCIPSKTLLHAAELLEEAESAVSYGIKFAKPAIDIAALRGKKDDVIAKLTGGLAYLAKARKVRILTGRGHFTGSREITVSHGSKDVKVEFENAVIATGSQPVNPSFIPMDDERVWDSTDALSLPFVPAHLAILGGGIIGLEMAQVYAALGAKITIIEMLDQLIPPADADLVRPLAARLKKLYQGVYTSTKLTAVKAGKNGLKLSLEGTGAPESISADALLVSVGRSPSSKNLGLETIGVNVDERGFIGVNARMETSAQGIYAIGDVNGNPMLAHKAAHEGKIAAEVIAGHKSAFTPMCIPSVAYTSPEIAWVGLTEKQAKQEGIAVKKGVFNWNASGRALSAEKETGLSKALFDKETGRLVGAGMVGARAGDLIAEAGLAIEMGADAADIGSTIHAHPTFAETLALAAEMAEGTITDALPK